jgi:hypothetical protein
MRKEFTVPSKQLSFISILLIGLIVLPKLAQAAAPAPAATPPSTPPPSSSAAVESQVISFQAADQVAANIATKICNTATVTAGSTIVIYDAPSFSSLQSFAAFVANIKALTASYRTLAPTITKLDARVRELALARHPSNENSDHLSELEKHIKTQRTAMFGTIGDPLADLTALASAAAVSSNVETPSSVVIPDSSIAVALTGLLVKGASCPSKALTVVYPPLFGTASASDYTSVDINLNIQLLQDTRQAAHEIVYAAVLPNDDKKLADGNAVVTKALTDIDGLYDNFMNTLLQPNAGSGVIGSAAVIQGYRLATLLSGGPQKDVQTHVLLASVVGAGGTERVHKTLWTALGSGDKITYSGGLIANVAMWKSADGKPEISEVMYSKSAFQNADGAMHKE